MRERVVHRVSAHAHTLAKSADTLDVGERDEAPTLRVMDGAALRTLLAERPLLADGGMGTSLIEQGEPIGTCFELLNVERSRSGSCRSIAPSSTPAPTSSSRTRSVATGSGSAPTASPRGRPSSTAPRWPSRVTPAPGSSPVRWGRSACAWLRTAGSGRRTRSRRTWSRPPRSRRAASTCWSSRRRRTCARWSRRSRPRAQGRRRIAVVVSATFTKDDRTLLGLLARAGRRASGRARRGRDRRELRRGSGAAAPRDAATCGRPPAPSRSSRARTPAVPRRSAVGSCTRRRPSTWRSTHARSSTKACRSSVGVAGPGPAHTLAIAEAIRVRAPRPRVDRRPARSDEPEDGPRPAATRHRARVEAR